MSLDSSLYILDKSFYQKKEFLSGKNFEKKYYHIWLVFYSPKGYLFFRYVMVSSKYHFIRILQILIYCIFIWFKTISNVNFIFLKPGFIQRNLFREFYTYIWGGLDFFCIIFSVFHWGKCNIYELNYYFWLYILYIPKLYFQ